jgi:hypothetical protein
VSHEAWASESVWLSLESQPAMSKVLDLENQYLGTMLFASQSCEDRWVLLVCLLNTVPLCGRHLWRKAIHQQLCRAVNKFLRGNRQAPPYCKIPKHLIFRPEVFLGIHLSLLLIRLKFRSFHLLVFIFLWTQEPLLEQKSYHVTFICKLINSAQIHLLRVPFYRANIVFPWLLVFLCTS